MFKGFVVLVGAGMVFAWLVFNFVSDAEQSDLDPAGGNEKYARYYKTDIMGEQVLDLGGVPEELARKIWEASTIRQELTENFPRFEEMRSIIENRLAESAFKRRLLQKLNDVESGYLAGEIDAEKARKILNGF